MKLHNDKDEEFEWTDVSKVGQGNYGYLTPIKKEWPSDGDVFWYIGSNGVVNYDTWTDTLWEKERKNFGNTWQTQELAEAVRDAQKELYKMVKEEPGTVGSDLHQALEKAQKLYKEQLK
jgi:hypothetical protein